MKVVYKKIYDIELYTFFIQGKRAGIISYIQNEPGHIYIQYIFVEEEFRKQDYSTKFFKYFEKQHPYYTFFLYTKECYKKYNKLVDLYKSWGFKKTNADEYYFYIDDKKYRKIEMIKRYKN